MTFEHLKIFKPFRQQKGDKDEETFSFSSQEYGMLVKGVVHAVNARTWCLVLGELMMLITPTGRMQADTGSGWASNKSLQQLYRHAPPGVLSFAKLSLLTIWHVCVGQSCQNDNW